MYKVLIATNNSADISLIRSVLQNNTLVSTILTATSFSEAHMKISECMPDFAIVDPKIFTHNGQIERRHTFPAIVIGHETECAIKAFDNCAFDFILAPISEERLLTSINRVITNINNELANENRHLHLRNQVLNNKLGHLERKKLVIRETGRIRLIDQQTIRYVKGAGNYVEIFLTNGNKIMHRGTLRAIENELDPDMFCRIHKSALIKMSLVEELRPTPKGDYRVLLRGGDDLTLSRNNKDKLKLLLENAEPVHI